jgi:nitrilase
MIGQTAHDIFCDTDFKRELLQQGRGFARIFGPEGSSLAEPLAETEEGLLYADLDPAVIAIAKSAADRIAPDRTSCD